MGPSWLYSGINLCLLLWYCMGWDKTTAHLATPKAGTEVHSCFYSFLCNTIPQLQSTTRLSAWDPCPNCLMVYCYAAIVVHRGCDDGFHRPSWERWVCHKSRAENRGVGLGHSGGHHIGRDRGHRGRRQPPERWQMWPFWTTMDRWVRQGGECVFMEKKHSFSKSFVYFVLFIYMYIIKEATSMHFHDLFGDRHTVVYGLPWIAIFSKVV